ncbi:hypothetical protein ACH492_35000 [Streptomyces sp. NPDC019443]|uniref:hypothetical protein n=1 Tax=Streptomyces sp. NPDC019443 TaxID=3365061 RepID=UPI0037A23484
MHRPKTTAKVLAGVAVWAVSGCVAVQPQPVPAPPSHSGRPAQAVEPQIVQRPAREVLAPPPLTWAETAALPSVPPPAARHVPDERPESPPPKSLPAKPGTAEPPTLPSLRPLPAVGPDVCALGESYGRWRPGSPESRICQEAYGS